MEYVLAFNLLAFIGGLLIGLAALVLMWTNGRIAGIAGIAGSALDNLSKPNSWSSELWWRLAFIVAIPFGAMLAVSLGWSTGSVDVPEVLASNKWLMIVAGLLVGFGTRLGSGCTSGHGVCGLGRLSKRSAVSTAIFMGVAALTVAVMGVWA